MPPIGDTLREARMRQQLDIGEVSERTKIRAKYLRALENEDWGLLPGPTFVKTFLRTYADVLGVDGHRLVEEFRANHEPQEEPELQPMAPTRTRRQRRIPGPPGRGVVAVGVILMFVAFLLVLGLIGDDDESRAPEVATQPAQTQTARRPARRKPRPAPVAAGVSVRVAPTVPTYACIDTGEGTDVIFEGNLEQPRTFKHARELRLNLGKRSVAVRANGKNVTFEPSPEPVGLDVTRTGTKEIVEGSRPCA